MHDIPLSLPPLSLYVHIPWCIRKCPYCDFNSHANDGHLPEDQYIQALIRELEMELPYAQGRKLSSIFFGGGTPSLFSAESIGRVIQAARRRFRFNDAIEITLEANPGTFEQTKFNGFRDAGVNRLSIGIQSFDDHHLARLGRIHSAENARDALAMARSAGFDNINLDLMHGLPTQTEQEAIADLQQAIDLAPAHISWYQLTIEPNTEFYRRPPTLPAEDVLDTIQESGHQLLADNGYFQYEVSAFCREKKFALHNRNYWEFGDYLGIGAGAHGKITLPDEQRIIRTAKTRNPGDYLARGNSFIASCKNIPKNELALEFMMNALRLNHGIEKPYFEERTGISLNKINTVCERLITAGLLENSPSHIVTTKKGHRFLNTVLCYFSE